MYEVEKYEITEAKTESKNDFMIWFTAKRKELGVTQKYLQKVTGVSGLY